MCAAAELYRLILNIYNAHYFAVFFAEKRHCAQFTCLGYGHFGVFNRDTLKYGGVYKAFNLFGFFGGQSRKMRKVKAHRVFVYKLTRLLNVRAQNRAQTRLQKVRRCVVAANGAAALCINFRRSGIIHA